MSRRDRYALTQVPSDLIQPGGGGFLGFGLKAKRVAEGQQVSETSVPEQEPGHQPMTSEEQAQDSPRQTVDSIKRSMRKRMLASRFSAPAGQPVRPSSAFNGESAAEKKKRGSGCGCAIAIAVIVFVVVVNSCNACLDDMFDDSHSDSYSSYYDDASSYYDSNYSDYDYDYSYDYDWDYSDADSSDSYSRDDGSSGGSGPGSNGSSGDTLETVQDVTGALRDALNNIERGNDRT